MIQQPPKSTAAVRPLVAFEGARVLYLGPALGLKPHRNAASTLAIGLDTPVRLTLYEDQSGSVTTTESFIAHIPSGHHHRLEAEGMMAFLYLDALSDDVGQVASLDIPASHSAIATENRAAIRFWSLERWRTVLGVSTPEMIDPRAAAVARSMADDPNIYQSLAEAARAAALSPTRFHAVFRRQVGAPFRRYRLWRRMGSAMAALASGANLTEAAFEAGFSSSAHFSHQFLRMFGLPPSALMALKPEIRCERQA